ncbi:hypothetical protein ACFYT3_31160 [Nocardia amikacinitolerans]|uniref:hypothetical protein n=1 Tax=Nocardia amikacinitolerans TaxID=756689 RepID=UPI00367FC64F
MAALFDAAREADVLTEDPRLDVLLDHDNTAGLPGFTLMLRNHHGNQDNLALTTGFTELLFPATATSTAAAARYHLEHIIEVANAYCTSSPAVPDRDRRESSSPTTAKAGLA